MPSKKPLESEMDSRGDSISEHATDWIRQFVKHLELNFVDASRSLAPDAGMLEYQDATIRAMYQTLLDSGMNSESVAEMMGQILIDRRPDSVEWNSDLNQRRFALIDKKIQETLTPAEKIELAGLTKIMREQLDSAANLPMEGAKALHRKLLELEVTDRPS